MTPRGAGLKRAGPSSPPKDPYQPSVSGVLLVGFQELAVVLALDHLGLEAELLGLLLSSREPRVFSNARSFVSTSLADRRRHAARHRPYLIEALLLKVGA